MYLINGHFLSENSYWPFWLNNTLFRALVAITHLNLGGQALCEELTGAD